MSTRKKLKGAEEIPFDDQSPWGRHRGPAWARWLLSIGHAVPAIPGGHHVAKWFRHPVRRRLHKPMDMRIWGYKLRLMTRGNVTESEWLYVPRFCEREERSWIGRSLEPGAVYLDIGANAGFYCVWADRCTDGRVRTIAVEPDPDMLQRLRFNCETNNIESVNTVHCALGEETGTAQLNRSSKNRGGNTLLDRGETSGHATRTVDVTVKRLDDLCEELDLERIDVLKIDVEGYEDRVLKPFFDDAPCSLWPRNVLIEHVHRESWGHDIIDLMRTRGYAVAKRNTVNTFLRLNYS